MVKDVIASIEIDNEERFHLKTAEISLS